MAKEPILEGYAPSLDIKQPTLWDCWTELNKHFLGARTSSEEVKFNQSRAVTLTMTNITMSAERIDLPTGEDVSELVDMRRLDVLYQRYVNPDLWTEGLERFKQRVRLCASSVPVSYLFQFHRRQVGERKVPKGGGCLGSLSLVYFRGRWTVFIEQRASEVTFALANDIYFIYKVLQRIAEEGNCSFDWENMPIVWRINMGFQTRMYACPAYLMVYGEEALIKFMDDGKTGDLGKKGMDWQLSIYSQMRDVMLNPRPPQEGTRIKWSRYMMARTETDWGDYFEIPTEERSDEIFEFQAGRRPSVARADSIARAVRRAGGVTKEDIDQLLDEKLDAKLDAKFAELMKMMKGK